MAQTSTHTVTITPTVGTPVFTGSNFNTMPGSGYGYLYCHCYQLLPVSLIASMQPAITGGNTINAATGAVTYAAGWSGTSTITASAAGCNGPKTATIQLP